MENVAVVCMHWEDLKDSADSSMDCLCSGTGVEAPDFSVSAVVYD